jgi:hypothetical protein
MRIIKNLDDAFADPCDVLLAGVLRSTGALMDIAAAERKPHRGTH